MTKTLEEPFGSSRIARLVACVGLALALVAGQVPAPAFGDPAGDADNEAGAIAARTQALIDAGDYLEHEALALVRSDAAAPTSNDGLSVLSNSSSLMDVSPAAVFEVASKANASEEMQGAVGEPSAFALDADAVGPSVPSAVIVLVHDESKTTQDLIESLLATEGVLAAEPNYLAEQTDGADGFDADEELQGGLNDKLVNAFDSGTREEGTGTAQEESDPTIRSAGNEIDENAAIPHAAVPAEGGVGDGTAFQWGNSNDGRMAGGDRYKGEDVNYPAWNQSSVAAAEGPVIAVLDSGVDGTNPDLANKLWSSASYPSLASIDGADEHGFSARDDDSTTVSATESGHGTHVAGIIAAEWNGTGTSGVSQNARLMALKHNDTSSGIIACFAYAAAAQKAGVELAAINASFAIGGGSSVIMDTAITEIGCGAKEDGQGAITVFATGNAHTNVDDSAYSGSLLSENPYVVMVNSIDADGNISLYSNYGEKTTDLAAPGSANLSTYPTSQMVYNGELDTAPVLYESFDDASDSSMGVGLAFKIRTKQSDGSYVKSGAPASTTSERSFDGTTSVLLEYAGAGTQMVESDPIDISAARTAGRADYLSIRYATTFERGKNHTAALSVAVLTKDGTALPLSDTADSFFALDGSWGGATYRLPETVASADGVEHEVDYEHFTLMMAGNCLDFDTTAGEREATPTAGDVYVDSIGIGSTLSPYKYDQGTSMAAPEVTGGAAVIVENSTSRGKELAARVRASASVSTNLEDRICLSNGTLDVSKGLDSPGPAITHVELVANGTTLVIEGYWFPNTENLEVAVDGKVIPVVTQEPGAGNETVIAADMPADFVGGQVEVRVCNTDTGDYAREFPVLGSSTSTTYYEKSLSVPTAVANWEKAQLVGWNGAVYALPQPSLFRNSEPFTTFERYDCTRDAWSEVALPQNVIASVTSDTGNSDAAEGVYALSAVPWKGKLAILMGRDGEALWTLDQNGAWEKLWSVATADGAALSWGTLASDGESLYSIGGIDGSDNSSHVYRFASGSWTDAGTLAHNAISPCVSYHNGAFLVSGGFNLKDQGALKSGVERITFGEDGKALSTLLDLSDLYTESGAQPVATGAIEGGFMLVGPESDDGRFDTYVMNDVAAGSLDAEDASATTVSPVVGFGKRASDLALIAPSALAYQGSFYVLSRLQGAAENDGFSFVSTSVATDKVAGDAADTKGLRYWYDQALGVDRSLYTDETAEVFSRAYTQAQVLLESNPTVNEQAAVDEAAADLKLAIEGLVEKSGGSGGGEGPGGGQGGEQGGTPGGTAVKLDTAGSGKELARTGDTVAPFAALAAAGLAAAAAAGVSIAMRRRKGCEQGRRSR